MIYTVLIRLNNLIISFVAVYELSNLIFLLIYIK